MIEMTRKLLVIGLDCAAPDLVFNKLRKNLPTFDHVMKNGIYGKMRTTHPPITIPAWAVMTTSKSPGTLGLYGFRHRKKRTYNDFYIASSKSVKEKAVWDIVSEHDGRSVVMSVPPGYPPKRIKGNWISCFITPSAESEYTFPPRLKDELEEKFGPFIFDVVFRTEKRRELVKELYKMTNQHFEVVKYLMQNKKWDFFMFVEIGVDRVHHAFWKFFDKEHHLYVPGNEFEHVIPEYYELIDSKIEELLQQIDQDTVVIITSDHGAKRMKGAFVVNQWLAENGYLKFKKEPDNVIDLNKADIDWSKTLAWGWGGYYARVFLNVKGREPNGVIDPKDYEQMRQQLIDDMRKIKGPNGEIMKNIIYRPEELYKVTNGDPPDLIAYFDDLYWRSAGTVGHKDMYLPENDKGPDDAVHDWDGIFMIYDPQETLGKGNFGTINIIDIAPTMLKLMGLPIPEDIEGKSLF